MLLRVYNESLHEVSQFYKHGKVYHTFVGFRQQFRRNSLYSSRSLPRICVISSIPSNSSLFLFPSLVLLTVFSWYLFSTMHSSRRVKLFCSLASYTEHPKRRFLRRVLPVSCSFSLTFLFFSQCLQLLSSVCLL
jgi:hypothetical protein